MLIWGIFSSFRLAIALLSDKKKCYVMDMAWVNINQQINIEFYKNSWNLPVLRRSPLIPHQGMFKPIKRINIFGTGQWQQRDWSHGKCWQIFCPISTHPWNPINHWKYLTRFLWPLSTFLFNPWKTSLITILFSSFWDKIQKRYVCILYNNASYWISPHLTGIHICVTT